MTNATNQIENRINYMISEFSDFGVISENTMSKVVAWLRALPSESARHIIKARLNQGGEARTIAQAICRYAK